MTTSGQPHKTMRAMFSTPASLPASASASSSDSGSTAGPSLHLSSSSERRPRSKVIASQHQHASHSESQDSPAFDAPFSPTHSSPIGYASAVDFGSYRMGLPSRHLFHSLDELALSDASTKGEEQSLSNLLHPSSASSSSGTGFSTVVASPPTQSVSPRNSLPSIQTQFRRESHLPSKPHTHSKDDIACTTPESRLAWRPARSGSNTPATIQSSRFDSPSASTALTTPSSYGIHQPFPPTSYYSTLSTNVKDDHASVPRSDRGYLGVEALSPTQDTSESEGVPSDRRRITPLSADTLLRCMHAGRFASSKHGRPRVSVRHNTGRALSPRTAPAHQERAYAAAATSVISSDPDHDRDPTGTPALKDLNCFSEFAKSGPLDALSLVEAKNNDGTRWSCEKAGLEDLSAAAYRAGGGLASALRLPPSSGLGQHESLAHARIADPRQECAPNTGPSMKGDDALPHHRHIATPTAHVHAASIAQEEQVEDQESEKSALDVDSTRPPLVIVVLSSALNSSDLVSSIEGAQIVCIHLSDNIVHQLLAGGTSSVAILDLEPFLVGEMSKRTYSTMVMDAEDALAKDAYWRADVVIVDGGDQGYGKAAGHGSASSASFAPLRSAASIALANTIQNLRNTDKGAQRPLFALEGGVTSLQTALRESSASTSKSALSVDPSSTSTSSPRVSSAPWISLPLAQSPSRIAKEKGLEISSSPSPLQSSSSPVSTRPFASPAPPPSTTTATRASRPLLARLDTSENVKRAETSRDVAKTGGRDSTTSSPRLALNTRVGPRSATIAESAIDPSPPLASPVREARRGSEPGLVEDSVTSAVARSLVSPGNTSRSFSLFSGAAVSASFEVSEIVEGFLYLGPDITTASEVDYLKETFGIKRILNAAYEIEAGGGKHLNLHEEGMSGIESYKKIPLKDTIEAQGVQRDIDEACAFIDDAKDKSAPIYVHCKAGKSRSVMIVMAYLIHANSWTLRKSYGYVVDRRRTVSPNIGFVAELMAFEMRRLKTDSSDAPDTSQTE